MWLSLALAVAQAGSYTLDDIVAASQRGMSAGAIQAMVESSPSWSVSHDEAVLMIRAGVSAEVVGALTGGAEPTAETLAAAKQPGPTWQRKAPAPSAKPKVDAAEVPDEDVDLSPRGLNFEVVTEVPGTADELYRRARAWFSDAFNDADRVLDLEDPTGHHLAAKPLIPFAQSFIGGADTTEGVIRYVVKIDTKEGRYRARIGDFRHDARSVSNGVDFGLLNASTDPGQDQCSPRAYCISAQWRSRVWDELKTDATRTAKSLLGTLEEAMLKSAPAEEDW